jgi:hypothetical protein
VGVRFKRSMDEQTMKERREAMHRARSAAWEAEKAEAQANKVGAEQISALFLSACWGLASATRSHATLLRLPQCILSPAKICLNERRYERCSGWQERFERVQWRTKNARAMRHAQVLRRFWHTSQGLVWQDALVVVMLGLSLGLSAVQLRPAATADRSGEDNKRPGGGDLRN